MPAQQSYDLPAATIEAIRTALIKVKTVDEYSDRALADMLPGVSRSRVNQLTSDETGLTKRGALGIVFALAGALWARGNTRLIKVIQPDDVVFGCAQGLRHSPDGCPHEEAADGHDAATDWRRAMMARDLDGAEQARTELRDALPKMRAEEGHLRDKMEGGPALPVPPKAGDGMRQEPAAP